MPIRSRYEYKCFLSVWADSYVQAQEVAEAVQASVCEALEERGVCLEGQVDLALDETIPWLDEDSAYQYKEGEL